MTKNYFAEEDREERRAKRKARKEAIVAYCNEHDIWYAVASGISALIGVGLGFIAGVAYVCNDLLNHGVDLEDVLADK